MRGKSHRDLGKYLAQRYMQHLPKTYVRAFLIGCVEPDRNYATYLKGSLRAQWLRGHNFENSSRFMQRLAARLESKSRLSLFDCYAAGKLIHYTVDAFTYVHNSVFQEPLAQHREYEAALQNYFLNFLSEGSPMRLGSSGTIMDTIRSYHQRYISRPADIRRDSRYAFAVTNLVAGRLFCGA